MNKKTMNIAIKLPERFTGHFIYVDCGAAGDYSNRLLKGFDASRFIGFDPGLSQPLIKQDSSVYFPVAVGKEAGEVQFHRTQNPNCSSTFVPNQEFLERFVQVDEFFKVKDVSPIKIVTLDEYLPQQKITNIDFIELDTQGAELDILNGAQNFLRTSVIGARIEVEFAEMYHNQPLFSEIDSWMRGMGFALFDLDRYHLRRKSCPADIISREQIVWGQALYLRDFHSFSGDPALMKQKFCKLIVVASYYGFHSYALEISDYLVKKTNLFSVDEKRELETLIAQYVLELKKKHTPRIVKWMQFLNGSFFHKIFKRLGNAYELYQDSMRRQKYFWKD